jgi:hypothetical protein
MRKACRLQGALGAPGGVQFTLGGLGCVQFTSEPMGETTGGGTLPVRCSLLMRWSDAHDVTAGVKVTSLG